MKGALVAFCNPLLDLTVTLDDDSLLKEYGLKDNDAILAEAKHLPLYETLSKRSDVLYTAGGSAQNSMRAAQWLLPANSTVFVGCVGDDDFGKQLRQVAQADGLHVEYLVDSTAVTGTCACLITQQGHCRSLVANLAAANNYLPSHLSTPQMQTILKSSQIIYISGYFLTVSVPSVMLVVKEACEEGKQVALNLSAPFICEFFTDALLQVLPFVDYIFGNESEAVALGKALKLEDVTVEGVAKYLIGMERVASDRHVVFTHGCEDTMVVSCSDENSVNFYPVPVIGSEEIVDTNGAGDAFVGGFLSQLLQGRDMQKCVDAGHYVASVIIRRSGVTFPPLKDSPILTKTN